MRPIGRSGGEDSSPTGINPHRRGTGATPLPTLVPFAIVWMPTDRGSAQNEKAIRCAISMGWNRKPVLNLQFAAIALVTYNGVFTAKGVSLLEAGSLKKPVIRAMYRVLT